jgi:aminoglycoside phosphotransferase (APT) family kinase protein
MSERLAAFYHAPRVLALEAPDSLPDLVVLVTEAVGGRALTTRGAQDVLPSLLPVLQRLHQDGEILVATSDRLTLREAYQNALGRRLAEDLQVIQERVGDLPDPIRGRIPALIRGASLVDEAVACLSAFDGPATAVTHGDPNWHNILHDPVTAAWHLLDWDDLAVGDPAFDWAVVLFRTMRSARVAIPPRAAALLRLDPATTRRTETYLAASIVDRAIDSLADYVEAVDWVSEAQRAWARRYFMNLHEDGWRWGNRAQLF